MPELSRRSFLQLAAAGALIPPGDPFEPLRRHWREVTLDGRTPGAAAGHARTMAPAAGHLWPGLPYPSLKATPARLLAMARAHALTGDAGVAAAVATGLDHYRRHVYTAGADPVGNWWDWEIGAPAKLLDAALLIGARDDGLAEAVDHFVPESRLADYSGTSTGANRVDLCTVTLLRAILTADPAKARLATRALSPVFRYVSEGDGLYRDGSFIQHTTVPYQGGYGTVMLEGLATLLAVLRGSPWEITDPGRRIVFDSVERSFAPFVHDGVCMALVGGRGVTRGPDGGHARGLRLASAILLLAESAGPGERSRWQAMVKGWAVRNPYLLDDARIGRVVDDGAVAAAAEPVGHRLLPMSARAVHRRPGWCAALSMASHRIAHYEHGNGENVRGWHTGSGMLHWWGEGHRDQYAGTFWRDVDPYRLPGTTVSARRLPEAGGGAWGEPCPPVRWVGGATDGTYATVGQHLRGLESTLDAFKSWFFLDDAVLCLGAGITCFDGAVVETVVDNRRSGARLTTGDGWAHLDGHGGYVVSGVRTRRAGGHVVLWLDHGLNPFGAGYAYTLLPNASEAATRERAADRGWARLLANTARVQGVRVPSLGLTAVNFWTAGTAGPLTASAPCAVLVRERDDGTATVSVSDPRRDLDELTVNWDRPVSRVLRADPLLVRATTGARAVLTFGRLATRGGASETVTLRLAARPASGPAPDRSRHW
ncbi:polysaccharide lyase 8 family protein [Nonomuraea sp. SBT364]|uniref:polysaccharide lyase 8 family protein n=1 Tax=Nonomuraea sp. SBT364 TaxID=1580530 RepID=UPI00066BC88A|nr:polysaccharide lyase 8 family protein [Nonomuraea sp. SBT364]